MPFSEQVKDDAFRRSGGRCECIRQHSSHLNGRGSATFTRYGGQWDAHHITAESVGGGNGLSNCEVLCLRCHKLTDSFGRS